MTRVILATFFLTFTSNAISQAITVTNTFVDGQTASAAEVNQNFTDLATKVNAIANPYTITLVSFTLISFSAIPLFFFAGRRFSQDRQVLL